MGGELDVAWADQAVGTVHFYISLGCFLIFRIVIAALQNWDELAVWFRLRRAGWTRWTRQAGL